MENRYLAGAARLAIVAALFLVWEALSRTGAVNSRLLPPVSDVFATLWDLLQRPRMQSDIAVTLLEVIVSFAISVPVGFIIGIIIAESRFLSEASMLSMGARGNVLRPPLASAPGSASTYRAFGLFAT